MKVSMIANAGFTPTTQAMSLFMETILDDDEIQEAHLTVNGRFLTMRVQGITTRYEWDTITTSWRPV